jgi:DNA polymerase-3 subunit beta
MKVICDRSALLSAVNAVAAVVPGRSVQQQLSGLKIVASKTGGAGELVISGTDAETSLQLAFTQVDVAQPGTVVVSADKLRQIVAAVDNEPTITLEVDGDICHIKGSRSRFKIFAYPPDSYPGLPEMPAQLGTGPGTARSVFTQTAGAMLHLINRTVFATAKETSRYAINGVLMKRDAKKLEMVATDGRRLALARAALKSASGGEGGPTSCIVPTKVLNFFARLAANPEEQVRVAVTDNRVFFAFEEGGENKKGETRPRAVLSSAVVEGAFPPYEDVIPKDQDKKVTADRTELLAGFRESAILTNEESRGVRLSFTGKEKRMRLTSRAPEMGESEIDVNLAAYEGDDVEISFNPHFIADALKAIDDPEVLIEMKAPNKPGVLRCGTDFLYVVMPVTMQN